MKYPILVLVALLVSATEIHSDPVTRVGAADLRYLDAQLPNTVAGTFGVDASFPTLKLTPTTQYSWLWGWWGAAKYSGTMDALFQTTVEQKCRRDLFPNDPSLQTGKIYAFISNVYKADNGDLLGFVHLEDGSTCVAAGFNEGTNCPPNLGANFYCATVKYTIGLAYSTNGGSTWKFCGTILKTNYSAGPSSNIGGVPYIVRNGYFYCYFNEHVLVAGVNQLRISVARAPIASVLAAALGGSVTVWNKYNSNNGANEGFNENGLTGAGSNIVPEYSAYPFTGACAPPCAGGTYGNYYDVHSDAAYSRAVNRYYLLVNVIGYATMIYSSIDGVAWEKPAMIDNTSSVPAYPQFRVQHAFPTIMTESSNTDDTREVGRQFYVVYPLKPNDLSAYGYDDIYRRKVSTTDDGSATIGPVLK